MRKFHQILFILGLLLSSGLSSLSAQTSGTLGNFSYSDNGTEIAITSYNGSGGDLQIPSTINGKPVTSIAAYVFAQGYISNLTSISIPNSVTSIGVNAFYGCYRLTNLTIPDSVTSIGSGAFVHCSGLTSISLPNSALTIEASAFSGCYNLTTLNIPSGVISIGDGAFNGCTSLANVVIGDDGPGGNGVMSIGANVFIGCTSLASVIFGNNVGFVGDNVFNGCTSLTSVTFGRNVTSIGATAFNGCISLPSVIFPGSVTSIGANAFSGCSNLSHLDVDQTNTTFASKAGVLYNCSLTKLIAYPAGNASTFFDIPNTVTSIADYAFTSCNNLATTAQPSQQPS